MDFKEITTIKYKEIREETIIHYYEIEDLCRRPYPNHPKGCPNIEHCEWLNTISFDIFLECNPNFHYYLVYAEFDFKRYKELRKIEHPEWSKNQVKCVLYWQNSVKKLIKQFIEIIYSTNTCRFYVYGCGSGMSLYFQANIGSMESGHINVFSTMKLNGIEFEVKPVNKIVLCNLLCSKEPLKFTREKQLKITEMINYEYRSKEVI